LAELYRAYEGQPVERRSVPLRIDTPTQPLEGRRDQVDPKRIRHGLLIGDGGAACVGHPALRSDKAAQPAASDDHGLEDAAGERTAPAPWRARRAQFSSSAAARLRQPRW